MYKTSGTLYCYESYAKNFQSSRIRICTISHKPLPAKSQNFRLRLCKNHSPYLWICLMIFTSFRSKIFETYRQTFMRDGIINVFAFFQLPRTHQNSF